AAADAAGNSSAASTSSDNQVTYDATAPVTTITLGPVIPDGDNGWYVSDVLVTVSATDDLSGVDETRCVLNPGIVPASFADLPAGPCSYASGSNVTADGVHTIYAASRDNASNVETPINSVNFKIDQTAPV